MTFKNYDWNLVTRIALLFVTLSASAFLLAQGIYLAMGVVPGE